MNKKDEKDEQNEMKRVRDFDLTPSPLSPPSTRKRTRLSRLHVTGSSSHVDIGSSRAIAKRPKKMQAEPSKMTVLEAPVVTQTAATSTSVIELVDTPPKAAVSEDEIQKEKPVSGKTRQNSD